MEPGRQRSRRQQQTILPAEVLPGTPTGAALLRSF
jgi:hypothetical protein